jgi:hypothetical protein
MSIRIRYILIMILVLVVTFCSLVQAVPRSDNFDDNLKGSMWGRFGVSEPLSGDTWFSAGGGPCNVWLDETNQRLEFRSNSNAYDETAVYGSLDWTIMTTEDFQMKIDFFHNASGGSSTSSFVFIGIIYDYDFLLFPKRYNYIYLAAGYSEDYAIYGYEQGGENTPDTYDYKPRYPDGGTLYVSYDADLDQLYLSDTGYGSANAWKIISGIVQNTWHRKMVGVAIGGNATGISLSSGQAYLDNFVIDSGTLCDGLSEADLNEDCKVDFSDFALFAAEWLDCNMDPESSCW